MTKVQKLIADIREQTIAGHASLASKSYTDVQARIYGMKCFRKIERILLDAEKEMCSQ